MTEVLFEVAGIEVVDIKSEEDTEYREGSCPTCGGDYYYSKSLILIDENQCETEVVILKDDMDDIYSVPLTLLTKLLSNKAEKENIKFMNITEFENYLHNTLFIYDQLTNEGDYSLNFRSFDSYIEWLENEYHNSYIQDRENFYVNENFYYEYPKVLKEEYLKAAKNYYGEVSE